MKNQQARNIRKELERLISKAHELGFDEWALAGFLEQLVQTPGLIHLKQYEAEIRQHEHHRTTLHFKNSIQQLELTYMALANVAVTARSIDLAIYLRDKYDLLLSALQGTSENLEETFDNAINVAGPKNKEALNQLYPDIKERIECAKNIVNILNTPKLSASERKDRLRPYFDRIEAVAPRHGQILSQIGGTRQQQDRGGGRRPKGASNARHWLGKRWDELTKQFKHASFEEKAERIREEFQLYKSEELYQGLTIEDRDEIRSHLDDRKYVLNLASLSRRGKLQRPVTS